MYILYLITSSCRWTMYDPSTPLGSCFQFSSLSCFSHPWLNTTNAYAFCSSFGYRYYSTRCWLVRHQLLTTNWWNKILRIHSGYDLSSGAVCRFCDSFLDSGHNVGPQRVWRALPDGPRLTGPTGPTAQRAQRAQRAQWAQPSRRPWPCDEPAVPRTGNPWFQDWEASVLMFGTR